MPINLINPADRESGRWSKQQTFVLWAGQCGPTYGLVYARSLEDALEIFAAWLADNAPGHIMAEWSDEHKELIKEVCEEDEISFPEGFEALEDEDKWEICERAEADLTRTESGFLASYEWGIALENPSREDLKAFIADHGGVTADGHA